MHTHPLQAMGVAEDEELWKAGSRHLLNPLPLPKSLSILNTSLTSAPNYRNQFRQ